METVHIDTSHNVAVHYEVATIVDRGLAVVVDWLILAGYTVAVFWLFALLKVDPPEWVMIILFGVPWTFYHLLSEIFMNGQSIGKRARNIKVARLDGGQAGLGHYIMRWVLRLIDSAFFLGAVVILFNGKGQRLGDLAAGTTVISIKQRLGIADTLFTALPPDHIVTFPSATRLSDAHARLLKEVLASKSEARAQLIQKLAVRLRDELAITTDLQPEAFLDAILADYLFLTAK